MDTTINLRIYKKSYEIIKSVKGWYNSRNEEKRKDMKETIHQILEEYVDLKELKYIDTVEDVEKELKGLKGVLGFYRIDSNFNPSIQEKIQAAKEYFENKNEKKTINEIIDESLILLFEVYPEINQILDRVKLTKQKNEIEKAKIKKEKEASKLKMRLH